MKENNFDLNEYKQNGPQKKIDRMAIIYILSFESFGLIKTECQFEQSSSPTSSQVCLEPLKLLSKTCKRFAKTLIKI